MQWHGECFTTSASVPRERRIGTRTYQDGTSMSDTAGILLGAIGAASEMKASPKERAADANGPSFDQELSAAESKPEAKPAAQKNVTRAEKAEKPDRPAESNNSKDSSKAGAATNTDDGSKVEDSRKAQVASDDATDPAETEAAEQGVVVVSAEAEAVVNLLPGLVAETEQGGDGEAAANAAAVETNAAQQSTLLTDAAAGDERENVSTGQNPGEVPGAFDDQLQKANSAVQAQDAAEGKSTDAAPAEAPGVALTAKKGTAQSTQADAVTETGSDKAVQDKLQAADKTAPSGEQASVDAVESDDDVKVDVKTAVKTAKVELKTEGPARSTSDGPAAAMQTSLPNDAVQGGGVSSSEAAPVAAGTAVDVEAVLEARGMTQADVVAQVGRLAAMSFRNRNSEVTIQLNPPELGSVRVKLVAGVGGLLDGRIVAEHEGTRALIERNLADLRTSLENAGVSVGRFDVSAQNQHNNGRALHENIRSSNSRRNNLHPDAGPVPATAGPVHDGRVNILV